MARTASQVADMDFLTNSVESTGVVPDFDSIVSEEADVDFLTDSLSVDETDDEDTGVTTDFRKAGQLAPSDDQNLEAARIRELAEGNGATLDEEGVNITPIIPGEFDPSIQPTQFPEVSPELGGVPKLRVTSPFPTGVGEGEPKLDVSEEEAQLNAKGVITRNSPARLDLVGSFKLGFGAPRDQEGYELVLSRLMEANDMKIEKVDGIPVRVVKMPDGSKRRAVINDYGLDANDITEFVGQELLPFVAGTTLGTAGAAVGSAAGPVGTFAAGVAGDALGTYVGEIARLQLSMKTGLLPDDYITLEKLYSPGGPAANEALLSMIGTVGVQGALKVVGGIHKVISGKSLAPDLVAHLRFVYGKFAEKNDTVISDLQKRAAEAGSELAGDIKPTVGQISADPALLALERHHRLEAANPPRINEVEKDPLGTAATSEALADAQKAFMTTKYGEAVEGETVGNVENEIKKALAQRNEDLLAGLNQSHALIQENIDKKLTRLAAGSGSVSNQTLVDHLQQSIRTLRDDINIEFDGEYNKALEMYKGLSGKNEIISELREELAKEQDLILEDIVLGARRDFVDPKAAPGEATPDTIFTDLSGNPLFDIGGDTAETLSKMADPETIITYDQVNATLTALRAKRRGILDNGRAAGDPEVYVLDRIIKGYREQRALLAQQHTDGGAFIDDLDLRMKTAKDMSDNEVVNRIMKVGRGDVGISANAIAQWIFTENKSGLRAASGDVTPQLMAIARDKPELLAALKISAKTVYAHNLGKTPTPEAHTDFIHKYEGVFQDIFGKVPKTIDEAGTLFKEAADNARQIESIQKAIAEDELLSIPAGNLVETIITNGTRAQNIRLQELMFQNPDLKHQYLRAYMNKLMLGENGKGKSVIEINGETQKINTDALQRAIAGIEETATNSRDLILRDYGDAEYLENLKLLLEVAKISERDNERIIVASGVKAFWANALQLWFGPLTKSTRLSNTAELYLRKGANRALIKALSSPEELAKLLKEYEAPSSARLGLQTALLGAGARFQYDEKDVDFEPGVVSYKTIFEDMQLDKISMAAGSASPSVGLPSEEREPELDEDGNVIEEAPPPVSDMITVESKGQWHNIDRRVNGKLLTTEKATQMFRDGELQAVDSFDNENAAERAIFSPERTKLGIGLGNEELDEQGSLEQPTIDQEQRAADRAVQIGTPVIEPSPETGTQLDGEEQEDLIQPGEVGQGPDVGSITPEIPSDRNSVWNNVFNASESLGLERSTAQALADTATIGFDFSPSADADAIVTGVHQLAKGQTTEGAVNLASGLIPVAGDFGKALFLGVRSVRGQDSTLFKAVQDTISGSKSAEQVRKETGWFMGKEGAWRFEIDDSKAKYIGPTKPHSFKEGVVTPDISFKSSNKLSDIVDHPELYKQYPQFADIPVRPTPLFNFDLDGAYDAENNILYLNPALPIDEAMSTALHETQHAIQTIEGFLPGGNPDMFLPAGFNDKKEAFNKKFFKFFEDRPEVNPFTLDFALKDLSKGKMPRRGAQLETVEILDKAGDLQDAVDLVRGKKLYESLQINAHKSYEKLAGEVESRNVQERLELLQGGVSFEDLPPPQETQLTRSGVPFEEQLTRPTEKPEIDLPDAP